MAPRDEAAYPNGPSLEDVRSLYMQAVENNWQTVQSTSHQAIQRLAASHGAAAEADALMKVARSLVAGEPTVSR